MTLGRYVHVPARSAPSERPHTQPAHNLRSQPPPQPPLTASAHFAVSFTELGRTPARNRFKGLSGHPPVGLHQPRRDSPRPQEAPGPREADIDRHCATLPSARRSRQAGLPSARRATERAHRAEHPAGPPPPSSSTRGVLPVPFPRPLAYGREHAAYPDSLPPPP